MARTEFDKGFLEAIKALKAHIHNKDIFPVIVAQWCLESTWGTSKKALRLNNFGGMKHRPELDKLACVEGSVYRGDWASDYDDYVIVDKPENYWKVYYAFISRKRYGAILKLKTPEEFLDRLELGGYCAKDPDEARTYKELVLEVMRGPSFRNLLKEIKSWE